MTTAQPAPWTTELTAAARRHLPAESAGRWAALLRPCVRLSTAPAGVVGPVVGRLGGEPELPPGTEWPVWEGNGPLSFVASIDCAALPTGELDIPVPSDGTLLFFYFDGQLDDGDALVLVDDRDSWAGARVVYVPAGAETISHPTPEDLEPYREVRLTARLTASEPGRWHPTTTDAFGPETDEDLRDNFTDAVRLSWGGRQHRIGGHPMPIQNPVEYEVAHAVLNGQAGWHTPELQAEAERWVLLAQIDSDPAADMIWGDMGSLYWLIRPADLAAKRFDRAVFNWQCS
ncbi:YwqG family protein [Kitasatospora sp. NPDC001175]|uniref:YwqG family protein n=1 Tax=Kitasatospora sp. NPDC001175 TaxID=3157103 RepID=UPI003D001C7C